MQLVRLKLHSAFNSLPAGFEYIFRKVDVNASKEAFSPFVLAGRNGSGKSNILEALSAIFFNIELNHLNFIPKKTTLFKYQEGDELDDEVDVINSKKTSPDKYELEYIITVRTDGEIKTLKVKIKKEENHYPSLKETYLFNVETNDFEAIKDKYTLREVLPDFVIGYSSGGNQTLSLPFLKSRYIQYDEYIDHLSKQISYDGKPESRLSYLDSEYSQAILLSNFLMADKLYRQSDDELKTPFVDELSLFKDVLKLEAITQFQIIIRQHHRVDYHEEYLQGFSKNELPNSNTVELTSVLKKSSESKKVKLLDKLKNCATCHFYEKETESLYLDYYVNDSTIDAFQHHFDDAIDLFQSFQVLLNLNLYSASDKLKTELYKSNSLYANETLPTLPSDKRVMRFKGVTLRKNGIKNPIYMKSLSDGEHQYLHSLGLCMLYKDKNCLFLLDEPETHFNPDWRAEFISNLKASFEVKPTQTNQITTLLNQREMLITTHSPFLISDSKQDKVLVFEKKQNKPLTVTHPEYNTLGASIDQITMLTLQKGETIGGVAKGMMDEFKKRFDDGEDKEKLLIEINRDLGDSLEKLFLIRTIQGRTES